MKISVASRLGSVEEYYFSKKLREIREMNGRGLNVFNLGIGSPDMAPHPEVVAALHSTASQDNMHGYQNYIGIPELRMAMGRWYSKYYKVSFDSTKEILPLIGSKEGIMHISMTYLEEGDEVLVPNPGYPAYASAAKLAGATIKHYDLKEANEWEPDFDTLENSDLSKVKIMWVNYPNMPTGKPASTALFERLIALGKRHNILIINDNPYSFILNDYPQSIMSVDGAMDTAMELNSLSKAHNMAGWRVGMLVGHGDRISEVLRFKSNMDSGMFRGTQEAAIKALELGKEWFEELNNQYSKRKQAACRLLDLLECEYDEDYQGLFVWAKVPSGYKDAYELADEVLYNSNVFITPGGIFGSNGDQFVRLSLCASTERFEEAIQRVQESLVCSKSIN